MTGQGSLGGRPAGFWITVIASGVLITVAVAVAGFLVGQSTRKSDDEVRNLLVGQVAKDNRYHTERRQRAIRKTARRVRTAYRNRLKREKAVALKKGQSEGYSSGSAAGYSSGKTAGHEEGYSQGYFEGSDDQYIDCVAYDYC
jgi:flagellar biosynthesis/type III secretory pathway protein FliH